MTREHTTQPTKRSGIPHQLHLGSLTYKVTTSKPAIDAACRDEGADLYGRTDHTKLLIVLDPGNAPAMQRQTLTHEVLHCITERSGLTTEMSQAEEEKLVRRIAPALLDLLRSNDELVRYLLG